MLCVYQARCTATVCVCVLGDNVKYSSLCITFSYHSCMWFCICCVCGSYKMYIGPKCMRQCDLPDNSPDRGGLQAVPEEEETHASYVLRSLVWPLQSRQTRVHECSGAVLGRQESCVCSSGLHAAPGSVLAARREWLSDFQVLQLWQEGFPIQRWTH